MDSGSEASPRLVQLALTTNNLSASLRLYSELFGFVNAGGSAAWGKVLAMQDLGDDAHCMVWWLVGATPLFQLEFFQHGFPEQRPLPQDWRPSDHGWVRFGIAVTDFDRVTNGLQRLSIALLGQFGTTPRRRLAFRDPYAGGIVEVIERPDGPSPAILYATSSVADLAAARGFYQHVVGSRIQPLDLLHRPSDEALWGMPDAKREGFLVDLHGAYLEILCYATPAGRPRPADYRSSDQGIMNVALGSRSQDAIRDLIGRVQASGVKTTVVVDSEQLSGTYIVQAGYELELMNVPEALEGMLGFKPASPFVTELSN